MTAAASPSSDPVVDVCMNDWDKVKAQFWSQVDKSISLSGCWIWTGLKTQDGYGRFVHNRTSFRAHRVSYEMSTGQKIPEGLLVCHTCDNPPCVNPHHLFLGDKSDNMNDYIAKYGHPLPRGITLHTKPRTSEINKLHISSKFPDLFNTIVEIENTPKPLATACYQGMHLSRFFYLGLKRNGESYLSTWLNENHVAISHRAMIVLQGLAFYREFTTYDMLLEYLKTHNWGELRADRGLDSYPQKSKQEEQEERARVPPKPETKPKRIEERDIQWLISSQHLTREQAVARLNGNQVCV